MHMLLLSGQEKAEKRLFANIGKFDKIYIHKQFSTAGVSNVFNEVTGIEAREINNYDIISGPVW